MAFLTMEASPRGYAIWNPRLVALSLQFGLFFSLLHPSLEGL
jgi:hypothetical protein